MLATPFDEDGEPDTDSLARLVEHVIASGADGLAAFGLAGEAHALSTAERQRLAEQILHCVAGRIPTVITATAESTPQSVQLARHAVEHGARVIMLAPPWVTKAGPQGLAQHYGAVAAAVDADIMIQDAPGYIGVALGSELIERLVREHPNVRYVKTEALPASAAMRDLADRLGEGATLFSGNGALYLLDTLRAGAAGTIPGCDIPEHFVAMYRSFVSGESSDAERLFRRLLPLLVYENQSLDLYVACTKAILARRGIVRNPRLRPPGFTLSSTAQTEIVALYDEVAAS